MNIKPGTVLWFVHNSYRGGINHYVKVAKVGRKWATMEGGMRADLRTGYVDGGGYTSPGRCYESEAVWKAEAKALDHWNHLKKTLEYSSLPVGLTPEDITKARLLLRLPLYIPPPGDGE